MNNQQKETRPEAAATVRDAQQEVTLTTSDSTPAGASSQAPAVEEFLQTSFWGFGIALDLHISAIESLRDTLALISEILDSDECSPYAHQYGAVASMAITFADKLREDMEKTRDGIHAHDMRRRALCGEVQA